MNALLDGILCALRASEPVLREGGGPLGVLALVDIRQRIESQVGRKADLLERRALRPEIRAALERDAIRVF